MSPAEVSVLAATRVALESALPLEDVEPQRTEALAAVTAALRGDEANLATAFMAVSDVFARLAEQGRARA